MTTTLNATEQAELNRWHDELDKLDTKPTLSKTVGALIELGVWDEIYNFVADEVATKLRIRNALTTAGAERSLNQADWVEYRLSEIERDVRKIKTEIDAINTFEPHD